MNKKAIVLISIPILILIGISAILGIYVFKETEDLSVYFEGEKHTDFTLKMQDFIISGGAYGNFENKIIAQQQKKGGKLNYIKLKNLNNILLKNLILN